MSKASSPKKLSLKREQVAPAQIAAKAAPVADLLVFHKIPNLQDEFSYLVPVEMPVLPIYGLVQVNFRGRLTLAMVLGRRELSPNDGELKFIQKIISTSAYASNFGIQMAKEFAERAGCTRQELLSAVLPKYIGNDRQIQAAEAGQMQNDVPVARRFLALPFFGSPWPALLREIAFQRAHDLNPLAILVPEERMLKELRLQLTSAGISYVDLSADQSSKVRSQNYRLALQNIPGTVAIGARNLIALPLAKNWRYLIVDEFSEFYYQERFPYFNVRDFALIRSKVQSVTFASQIPSLELQQQIASGWLLATPREVGAQNVTLNFGDGRLSAHQIIRKGIKSGPVLYVVARKGYVTGLKCRNCRNYAVCDCGARLHQSEHSAAACSKCEKRYPELICKFCQSKDKFLASATGANWRAEEFGKAFPGIKIRVVTGESEVATIDQSPQIVIATIGSAPEGDYSAIVLADGEALFGQINLRAEERARYLWLRELRKIGNGGNLFIDLPTAHPFSQAIIRLDFSKWLELEAEIRAELKQPPFSRNFVLHGLDSVVATNLQNLVRDRFDDQIGLYYQHEAGALIITAPVKQAGEVLSLVRGAISVLVNRSGLRITLKVDPFDPY